MPRVLDDVALERLLTRANLNSYERWTWFRDCSLVKPFILVPSRELADSLTRCYLPQIRQVMADCEIKVHVSASKKQVAYRGETVTTDKLEGL